jgi:hypothetical protein
MEELVAARIDDLRRQASLGRRALPRPRPSAVARVARRSVRAFGFLLVGAGLRLAMAGERPAPAGRRAT